MARFGAAGSGALIETEHIDGRFPTRLWQKDSSLWSDDPATRELIGNRLGWLELIESIPPVSGSARSFVEQIEEGDVDDVVLLGMGGRHLVRGGLSPGVRHRRRLDRR